MPIPPWILLSLVLGAEGAAPPSATEVPRPEAPAAAPEKEESRVDFGVLPLVNYDADLGLGLGLNTALYFRAPGYAPYQYTLGAQAFFTFGGVQNHYLYFEAPNFLGSGFRPSLELDLSRDVLRPYYGIGNDVAILDEADPRYLHDLFTVDAIAGFERELGGGFELIASYSLAQLTIRAAEDSLLLREAPVGAAGGLLGKVSVELSYDTRNVEASPTSGVLAGLALRAGHLGTSAAFAGGTLYGRTYLSPFGGPGLVVALRGVFDAMAGDVPFTELQLFGGRGAVPLTGLGGARSIRGLPRLHYIGKVKALANVELRSRVLRFTPGASTLDFWLVGFVDAGRVWTDLTELFTRPGGRIHGSAGGGLRIAWVEDYVVRVDYGWSNEGTTGLYIGFEQTF